MDRNDQIAHEEQRRVREDRDREIDPDNALNDEDEQDRHADRFECEQQHDQHDQNVDDADDRIVAYKATFQSHIRSWSRPAT
ncbi:MAG: hypothetical protein ACLU3I_19425 [Acutalibacteraceae bacterium]